MATFIVSSSFVPGMATKSRAVSAQPRIAKVRMSSAAAGDDVMVPDMKKRNTMNLLLAGAVGMPATIGL
eukprot:CAMPEP_0184695604 /NCGR_PEP_ID=MMETSP0313-20130426/3190_1 /TAXON_ID=2792 /ORGANISM="Porphyridium aerugineum, Strain SAG 1380-2" /LENGTH=68 /DNA_ID=CAMNT_0027154099 /DNA_START=162 /DNA_END=365 /DNA_ORIENTATION=-